MTEADLLQAVRDLARWRRWLTYHTYRSTRSEFGFPDLVLARADRLLFAELKVRAGTLTLAQRQWRDALVIIEKVTLQAVEYHLWTPKEWNSGAIDAALT